MQYNNTDSNLRNILLTISYDGRRYHGWQVQQNSITVQEEFQKCLEKIVGKTDIKGCSRTDSKVHANRYCLNFLTDKKVPCNKLKVALNNSLPVDISVLSAIEVPIDFHARYSNSGKQYRYKIWNSDIKNPFLNGLALHHRYKLDWQTLDFACKGFIGKKDFTSFCNIKSQVDSNVRMVYNARVYKEGSFIIFEVSADGFLYNMVRIMVGTLIRLSQKLTKGEIKKEDAKKYIEDIIDAKERQVAGSTAPADGLYLDRVFYKGELDEKIDREIKSEYE